MKGVNNIGNSRGNNMSRYNGSGRYSGTPSVAEGVLADPQPNSFLTNYGQRPLKKPVIPTYLNDMSSAVGWSGGNVSVAEDADNYVCGPNAILVTKTATDATAAPVDIDPTLGSADWSNSHIYVRFYIHEGTGDSIYTNISKLELLLFDTIGGLKTYRLFLKGVFARSGPGWHEAAFTIDESAVSGASLDTTDINLVRLNITTTTNAGVPAITFDEILVIPEQAKPIVMIRLDDGWKVQYDMATYANSKGLPVTICSIKEYADLGDGGNAAYMTTADLQRLQEAGNLILNHTIEGTSPDLSGLTDAQLRDRIVQQQQWMCENGLSRGSRIFTVPQGKLANAQMDVVQQLVDFVWWIDDDGRSTTGAGQGIAIDYDRFYCSGFAGERDPVADTAAMNAKLAEAILANGVYCPFWHDANANYEGHIDQIATDYAAGNIIVTTPDRYINRT